MDPGVPESDVESRDADAESVGDSRPLPSPSCTLSANKRRKLKDDAEVQVLKSIAQSLAKSDEKNVTNNSTDHKAEDDVSAFCAYVEQCMRKMDDRTKNTFRFHVNNAIYQAQCGLYGEQVPPVSAAPSPVVSLPAASTGTQNITEAYSQMLNLNSW